mmetsp:Transcript_17919/g.56465  ORF Transcript_17919/g.56465 Transcript_17919/m.56465 type:complete len:510 (+) Transcript_17919:88-1617(+)
MRWFPLPCLLALWAQVPVQAALVGRSRSVGRFGDIVPKLPELPGDIAGNLSQGNQSCNCSGNSTVKELIWQCKFEGGAEAVAMGLIFAVMVAPVVLYMALSGGTMSFLTLKLVDTTISIFLALLWFSAFSTLLNSRQVHALFAYAEEVFALLQVMMLYVIVSYIAYLWRDKDVRLMTLGSCGGHYVAFAGIRAAGETQFESSKAVARFIGEDYGHWASIVVCALGFLVIEEMELDILGLTGSFAVTQAVRHVLTGSYPPRGHLLLQLFGRPEQAPLALAAGGPRTVQRFEGLGRSAGPQADSGHEAWQRWCMLGWAMGLTILAAFWLMYLSEHGEFTGKIARKCSHVMRVLLIMCIAWGYLLWGEWVFVETFFEGHSITGQMSFAVIATLCSLVLIMVVAGVDLRRRSARHFTCIGVMGASLVAAWSWEHIFDAALDTIAERYQVGFGGLVPKVTLALVIPAAVLPVYVTFIKPKIMEESEAGNWAPELDLLQGNSHSSHTPNNVQPVP